MFTLNDLFDIAAKMEENGKRIYLKAMTTATDPALKDLLKWMADEEECHRHWFLDQKVPSLSGDEDLEEMIPDVIRDMMGENSLSLDEVDFGRIKTPAALLNTFIGFENDTILFYEFLDTFVSSEPAREGLKRIIREESAHVDQLTEMAASFSSSGS